MSASHPPFVTPWWLPDPHTQTLWRRFAPMEGIRQRRERLELNDGDFIDLDWVDAELAPQRNLPVVLLLHGLCGCSSSPYIQSTQRLLRYKGYSSVAMNFRGCSGEINRLARAYHSGCTEDLEEVYQSLRARMDGRPLALAGFSLGGNVLLKWLAEIGSRPDVLLGVAVSTPFSLSYCSGALNSGLSKAYGHYFRRRLVRDVEAKKSWFRIGGQQQELEKLEALGDLRRLQTLWDFDDQVTAPLHGFAGAEDYYARCSSGPWLSHVVTPVQLIQSGNDPIIPLCSLPETGTLPAHISLLLTESGGHVGFTCSGEPLWLEERIVAAIDRTAGRLR